MSGAVTPASRDLFEVDFAALKEGGRRFWRRAQPVAVDEFLLGRALEAVLAYCDRRDLQGRLLLWNDLRIFLSEEDFRFLEVNLARTRRDLEALVLAHARAREASFIQGIQPTVVLSCDLEAPLPQGTAKVRVGWRSEPAAAPPGPASGEVTTRAGAVSATGAPLLPEATRRLPEGAAQGGVILRWAGGEALLESGRRYTVGRASPENVGQPDFVRLEGAGATVSRAHLFVEVGARTVTLQRPLGVNAVLVGDQPLTEGGRCFVDLADLPVSLRLADGAVAIELVPRP
jgi:hypothetical protein